MDKGHGRLETRRIWTSTDLNGHLDFPHCRQVACIERSRENLKTGKINQETAYLITSLSPERADPEKLLSLNRGHWGIENKSHYVRDVTFDEDRSQVRTQSGPRVMATLRNLAINLLRLRGYKNIAQAIRSLERQTLSRPLPHRRITDHQNHALANSMNVAPSCAYP